MNPLNALLASMVPVPGKKGNDDRDPKFEKDLLTGLISLILLSICASSTVPLYGYQIARKMEAEELAGPRLKQGTIYPVLRALEKNGLLKSQIKASASGPPRKYYLITEKGRKKLEVWQRTWWRTRDFVDIMMGGGHDE